jgi:23S rRNA (uracil1939-C5)-methyltransferase
LFCLEWILDYAQVGLARQPLQARELGGFAAVVLDPPLAGAAARTAQIAAARPPVVIYVSCNPATLSADARLLRQANYDLNSATPIDQFLWSARLESVCVFTLASAAGPRRTRAH